MDQKNNIVCHITKKKIKSEDAIPFELINPKILKYIKKDYPDFGKNEYISKEEYKKYRYKYVEDILNKEKGELTKIDKDIIESSVEQKSIVKSINESTEKLSFSDRLADKIAAFGGSWGFILSFFIILIFWIILNTKILVTKPYDPYPFILLNLVLSCLAAIQAPIIMMSQNRKEEKDRQRAENDYKINLKAEIEIRQLHDKLDHLIKEQWQRLLEIQKLQIELLDEKNSKK